MSDSVLDAPHYIGRAKEKELKSVETESKNPGHEGSAWGKPASQTKSLPINKHIRMKYGCHLLSPSAIRTCYTPDAKL